MAGDEKVDPGAPTPSGPAHSSGVSQYTHRRLDGPCVAIVGNPPAFSAMAGDEKVDSGAPTPSGPCHWASAVSQYSDALWDAPCVATVGNPSESSAMAGDGEGRSRCTHTEWPVPLGVGGLPVRPQAVRRSLGRNRRQSVRTFGDGR